MLHQAKGLLSIPSIKHAGDFFRYNAGLGAHGGTRDIIFAVAAASEALIKAATSVHSRHDRHYQHGDEEEGNHNHLGVSHLYESNGTLVVGRGMGDGLVDSAGGKRMLYWLYI